MESLLVVTNPDGDGSGGQGIPDAISEAIGALRKQADVHVCRVSMPGDLDGALHRRGGRKIVVAGGDSHLHTVVGALHKRNELDNAVLAILPDGPESDFARSAGIPGDPARAADVVLHGVERRFDLLEDCRGDIVVSNVHLGVSGRPHRPRIWPMRSAGGEADIHSGDGAGGSDGAGLAGIPVLAALHALHDADHPRARPFHVRIEADDQVVTDFDRPVLQVAVTNSTSSFTSSFTSPDGAADGASGADGRPDPDRSAADAELADGYVDVVVNFAVDPLARARRALKLGHDSDGDTVTVRARRVSVAGQRFWLNSDGQDSGAERRCTWNVVPQRLRVIVPAGS
ncbi:diacylglycerol kinase family protein [Actinopolymorpha rutila]|uniref:Diacylglycerol kinase family enzyme n=1 Tax=Actinopolymorpha rutila TaxID=446787 RepID=A0A852Z8H1_9ACTN|nr:diacylglycerol kinase family enzyme [Actinopolymorpha rutila]